MIEELHTQIQKAERKLVTVGQANLSYEARLHRAPEDLMDIAARHDLNLKPWVDHSPPPPLV